MKRLLFFLIIFFCLPLAFAASGDAYLVEIGEEYINQGRLQQAKVEFQKALQVNPANSKAKEYLNQLRQREIEKVLDRYSETKTASKAGSYPEVSKGSYISSSNKLSPQEPIVEQSEEKESKFSLKGDYQLSFGVESGDFIWKRADADLNETNWRILSDEAYNRWQNTFDPAIFSQLRLKTDYNSSGSGFGFHSYIDISPWSFIGKSNKVTVTSAFGDTADVQLKYWANTRYTIGETVYSNLGGNIFNLGEQKVVDGKVASFSREGLDWDPADTFDDIEELKIKREFWPLRELWFDFTSDNASLRVFPAALQDQAYSSDDPLKLTNRHNWWQSSPWLSQWEPGQFNPTPADFFKGFWDDSLAYLTRNSAGERLTNLRGLSLSLDGTNTLLDFTAASPKNLWQDYDQFDTLNTALRGKYFYGDNLILGMTHASKHGFDSGYDAFNHVWGFDANLRLTDRASISVEAATSRSEYDRKSGKGHQGEDYDLDKRGNVYQFNLTHSSENSFGKDFYGVRPEEKDDPFHRIKLSFTRMDSGFDAALADYRHTRDDAFWSRHLTFRRPFAYEYFGLHGPVLDYQDDIYPFRIGDGIDSGRNVISLRWEAENIINQNLDLLFDIRDVRKNSGGLIENVSRLEGTYRFGSRLRLKGLGIYHHAPKTKLCPDSGQGIVPFLETDDNRRQRSYYTSENVEEGKDPSLKTVSLGVEYDFFDWLAANFVWERSNDVTLAYDNFPLGLFAWDNVDTYTQEGRIYREQTFGLYDDLDTFPTPPYPYYNIFKTGFRLEPLDDLELYFSYTHNEYNWAQLIDDNMNHLGLEASYIMDNKLGFYLRYVYSRVNNLRDYDHGEGAVKRTSHHNVFSEIKYRPDEKSELVFQYGVGGYGLVATPTETPFGGGVAALDTQHIFRVYYRKKF